MKKAIAMKWIKALRSGKYKQAKKQLHNVYSNGFCCLGVLCEITNTPYELHETVIPESGLEQTSLKDDCGLLPISARLVDAEGVTCSYLADYNDRLGYSFNQLAKLISKHWRYL